MQYRYSPIKKLAKRIYRLFIPVPKSPWTAGRVDNICDVNLVPPDTLINFFSNCIDVLKKIKGDNVGDYLEFGVFNGNSIGSMYLALKKTKTEGTRLFGFDAFEGLPPGSEKEDDGVWKKGFYHCSFEDMNHCLLNRMIDPDEINWIKGWYNETLNLDLIEKYNIENIGLVFIDCDTYSSSKSVLDFIGPLIKKPLIICLDDWKLNDLDIKGMGEYKSFNEFLDVNKELDVTELKSYNRKSKTFLIKPNRKNIGS